MQSELNPTKRGNLKPGNSFDNKGTSEPILRHSQTTERMKLKMGYWIRMLPTIFENETKCLNSGPHLNGEIYRDQDVPRSIFSETIPENSELQMCCNNYGKFGTGIWMGNNLAPHYARKLGFLILSLPPAYILVFWARGESLMKNENQWNHQISLFHWFSLLVNCIGCTIFSLYFIGFLVFYNRSISIR